MSAYQNRRRPHYDTLAGCYCAHVDVVAIREVFAARSYRSATLGLIALILSHGDLSLTEVRRKLVCQVCGGRSFRLQIHHQPGPVGCQPPREPPVKAQEKIAAGALAPGMTALNAARAEIHASKPMRF